MFVYVNARAKEKKHMQHLHISPCFITLLSLRSLKYSKLPIDLPNILEMHLDVLFLAVNNTTFLWAVKQKATYTSISL